jgi:hypothetical protein
MAKNQLTSLMSERQEQDGQNQLTSLMSERQEQDDQNQLTSFACEGRTLVKILNNNYMI